MYISQEVNFLALYLL